MNNKSIIKEQLKQILLFLVLGFIGAVLMAFPVKWCWNWLIPLIFGLQSVSAVQAWGLVFLGQLMFPRISIAGLRKKEEKEKKEKK